MLSRRAGLSAIAELSCLQLRAGLHFCCGVLPVPVGWLAGCSSIVDRYSDVAGV